jgi:protein-tyrosine-phosphatase
MKESKPPIKPIKVMFICYGNRCRSPAAEGYAKKYAADRHLDGLFQFSSAGFNSLFCPAEPNTVHILREEDNIDLSGFSSQNVHRDLLLEADYILTMEGSQRDMIRGGYTALPGVAEKVFTLKEIAGRGPDPDGSVHDPYDEPIERYRAVMHEIKLHIPWVIEEILRREHKEHYLAPPPLTDGNTTAKASKTKSYKKKRSKIS